MIIINNLLLLCYGLVFVFKKMGFGRSEWGPCRCHLDSYWQKAKTVHHAGAVFGSYVMLLLSFLIICYNYLMIKNLSGCGKVLCSLTVKFIDFCGWSRLLTLGVMIFLLTESKTLFNRAQCCVCYLRRSRIYIGQYVILITVFKNKLIYNDKMWRFLNLVLSIFYV